MPSSPTDAAQKKALAELRQPFPEEAHGKKPIEVDRDGPIGPCGVCGKRHRRAAGHLDFIGHAEVTARLLDVDPLWSWEPVAWDDNGQPATIKDDRGNSRALWIRLTVAGVTRLGVGTVDGGKGTDGLKELVGDAIRNAGMRFGIALDLWGAMERQVEIPADESASVPEPDTTPLTVEQAAAILGATTAPEPATPPQAPPPAPEPTPEPHPTPEPTEATTAPVSAGTTEDAVRAEFIAQAAKLISGLRGRQATQAYLAYRRQKGLPSNLAELSTPGLGDLVEFLLPLATGQTQG